MTSRIGTSRFEKELRSIPVRPDYGVNWLSRKRVRFYIRTDCSVVSIKGPEGRTVRYKDKPWSPLTESTQLNMYKFILATVFLALAHAAASANIQSWVLRCELKVIFGLETSHWLVIRNFDLKATTAWITAPKVMSAVDLSSLELVGSKLARYNPGVTLTWDIAVSKSRMV